jgi:3-hydroxybutyryl-CoA dehydrogenase
MSGVESFHAARKSLTFKRIAVIGAGQMGCGIAQVCSSAGYEVLIYDVSSDQIAHCLTHISQDLKRKVEKGQVSLDVCSEIEGRIKRVPHLSDFRDADLVIEAASENESIKKKIFEDLCSCLHSHAFIGTNTSSLSITRLATYTDRPERFIGLHFMNPPTRMQLVEVIPGMATSSETHKAIENFIDTLGKTSALSQDSPAFLVNRILLPMINEAIFALYEGVGSIESIDKAMHLGANHPMGPFQLADFIGLDTCLAIMQILHEGLGDSKYRPCPLLMRYVEAGWLGRKTARGFYDYSGDKPTPTR